MYEPAHLLSDVSLHLSFLATAGIIYLSDGFTKLCIRIKSDTYREIIATTCAAYVATLPYIMYTFGTVSLYALVTNMIVLPLVPPMMLLTFLVVVSAPVIPVLGIVFGYICTMLGEIIIFIARIVESLPFASLRVSVSFFTMLCMYMIGAFLVYVTISKSTTKKNETLLTKNDGILSDVIAY
jgi:competence protein ComEC